MYNGDAKTIVRLLTEDETEDSLLEDFLSREFMTCQWLVLELVEDENWKRKTLDIFPVCMN